MRQSLTYGEMPEKDDFLLAVEEETDGCKYRIRAYNSSDPAVRHADGDYTAEELYNLVNLLSCGDEASQDLACSILFTLGFEWI